MGPPAKSLSGIVFAVISGIFAMAGGAFLIILLQIWETASVSGGGTAGLVERARAPIFITAFAVGGFVYGRHRGSAIVYSLAAASPILLLLVAALSTAGQVDPIRVAAGVMRTLLPPMGAYWLGSLLGWRTTRKKRREDSPVPSNQQ